MITGPHSSPPDSSAEARRRRLAERRAARAARTVPGPRARRGGRPFASGAPRGRPIRRSRRPAWRGRLLVAVPSLLIGLALSVVVRATGPEVRVEGSPASGLVGMERRDALTVEIRADDPDLLQRATLVLDGRDARSLVKRVDGGLVLRPRGLGEGEHRVEASVDRGFPRGVSRSSWRFVIDTTAPRVELNDASLRATAGRPYVLAGRLGEQAKLTIDGRPVRVREGGFSVSFAEPPRRPIELVAVDPAGNVAELRQAVAVAPRRPPAPVRAVHVTALAWATEGLREPILEMIDEGLITAVELDLKDESGIVGYDSAVPLARALGARRPAYDLDEALELLHDRGVHVIGRIVAFRDPVHARAAWADPATRDQVVQTPDGSPYAGYGGFTNFAHPSVRDYNIDLAEEAARRGVDDILYDYVRRPDGPLSGMVFPGLRGSPARAVAGFLAEARARLGPRGAFLGASVFGIAATRPGEIAQDIARIAREVDYVAPMLYPSHWSAGEYGVADPNVDPYRIVRRSLEDFVRATSGTGARVVPWLQDFSLGRTYGPAEVAAQVQAARDAGVEEWILWDPAVTYTDEALTPASEPG